MPTIAAKPHEFVFPLAGVALVVIDMQRDFVEPSGFGAALGNDVSLLRPAIAIIGELLDAFRRLGLTIVHTREGHPADLSDCPSVKRRGAPGMRIGDMGPMGKILVQGEPGHDIIPELAPRVGEIVIDKPGKGSFYKTDLESVLSDRGVTHLVFTGVTTEVCVQTSMREAADRGFHCLLVEDATESYFPAFKRAVIEMVRSQGAIVGWTTRAKDILAALEEPDAKMAVGADGATGRRQT